MELKLPQLKNSVPSKQRLHGTSSQPGLSYMVGKPIPSDFNPDEISWVRPRIGVTDWEGGFSAITSTHYVITVAPEINIGADALFGLEPYSTNFSATLNQISDRISKILTNTKKNVVLHCAMGMERAPLAAVWYIHRTEGISIKEAYQDVIATRPIVCNRETWLA